MRYVLVLICAACCGWLYSQWRHSTAIAPIVIVMPIADRACCFDARQLDTYRVLLSGCHARVDRCIDLLEVARDGGRSP